MNVGYSLDSVAQRTAATRPTGGIRQIVDDAARRVGLDPAAVQTALHGGATLAELANENDIDEEAMRNALTESLAQHGPAGRSPEHLAKIAEAILQGSRKRATAQQTEQREVPRPRSAHGPRDLLDNLAGDLGVEVDDLVEAIASAVEDRARPAEERGLNPLFSAVTNRLGTVGLFTDTAL